MFGIELRAFCIVIGKLADKARPQMRISAFVYDRDLINGYIGDLVFLVA